MKYKFEWKLVPILNSAANVRTPLKASGGTEIELDDDEAGILPQDLHTDHPLRPLLEICGPVPVVLQCRGRGGERLKIPTLEFLTKSARTRRRASHHPVE